MPHLIFACPLDAIYIGSRHLTCRQLLSSRPSCGYRGVWGIGCGEEQSPHSGAKSQLWDGSVNSPALCSGKTMQCMPTKFLTSPQQDWQVTTAVTHSSLPHLFVCLFCLISLALLSHLFFLRWHLTYYLPPSAFFRVCFGGNQTKTEVAFAEMAFYLSGTDSGLIAYPQGVCYYTNLKTHMCVFSASALNILSRKNTHISRIWLEKLQEQASFPEGLPM